MAPTPSDVQPNSQPTDQPSSQQKPWSTGGIVVGAVFLFLLLVFIASIIAFWLRNRKARNSLPPERRSSSYRPFRTESSDKKGLLANQAPGPEDDKTSMFSRDRRTSVSLYVDTEMVDKRVSMENVNLIPLHITPAEEVADPMAATISNGSGMSGVSSISRMSSRYSIATSGSLGLSPMSPMQDGGLGSRPTRPRSSSSASARYYSNNSPDNTPVPQIPKIVHTVSQ